MTAGFVYFAVVFAAGFVFGILRLFVLSLYLSPTPAVLVELPIMLAVSWFACKSITSTFKVPAETQTRAVVGGVAFGFLIVAEYVLSSFFFGETLGIFLAGYLEPAGSIGLFGQILFALFPLIQLRLPSQSQD